MQKEFNIKLIIDFPEYEDLKAEIKECKRKWKEDDFMYINDVTYTHTLVTFPSGSYRIYSGEDNDFKLSFDEMEGRYLSSCKSFNLNKKGYKEFINYAINEINSMIRVW